MVMEAPNECLRKEDSNRFFLDVSIYFDWDLEKSGIKCFSGSTMDRGKEKRDRNVSVMKNIDRIRYLDNSNFDWYLSIGKGISMMDRGEDRGVLKE